MFLTPDGQPFWGGTYFPPFTRGGRPGFAEVLQTIAELWRDRANAIEQNVKQLGAGLASLSETTPAEPISSDLVEAIREQLEQRLDRVDGGFGAAPKFPQATNLDFLWRAWKRTGRDALRQGVLLTLDHISQGGVYDHLGSIELLDEETEAALARDRAVLFSLREGRVRPARDDKVLADWNGLTIAAIAKASCVFERLDWLDVAIEAFHFVRSAMTTNDGRLLHSWRAGRARHSAVLDDYAAMCRAALALHEATGAPSYLERGRRWVEQVELHYRDRNGGYFFTADDAEALIARAKIAEDSALSAGNGMMLQVLAQLYHLTGESVYRERAEAIANAFSGTIRQRLLGFSALLNGIEALREPMQIVVVGAADGADTAALKRVIYGVSRPGGS